MHACLDCLIILLVQKTIVLKQNTKHDTNGKSSIKHTHVLLGYKYVVCNICKLEDDER